METKEWKQVKMVYLAGRIDKEENRVDYKGKIPEVIIKEAWHEGKTISKWRLDFLQEWNKRNSFSKITWILPELNRMLGFKDVHPNCNCVEDADAILFFVDDYKENINVMMEIGYAKGLGKFITGIYSEEGLSAPLSVFTHHFIKFEDDWLESLLIAANPLLIESPIEFRLWESLPLLISQVPIVTKISLYGCEAGNFFTRADFIMPDSKIVVYCDGYEFHSEKETFKRDRIIDRILIANGYIPVRFSGSEIFQSAWDCKVYLGMLKNNNFDNAKEQISDVKLNN